LFDSKPELRGVIEAFHYSDAEGADFFNGHIEKIYGLFAALSPTQIDLLQEWFIGNNDIAGLCRNDPGVAIARYSDLKALNGPLGEAMSCFFKGLYSPDLLDLKALKSVIGEIDLHYKNFVGTNSKGKCPFCGINDVKVIYHSNREAYDHYLPKTKYPFNSINFKNLVPACHECNSSYKHSKDPLHNPKDPLLGHAGGRRKSFYPYQAAPSAIELRIELHSPDWENIKPQEITISVGPEHLREEINTWLDVYDIEERYKAKCCGENDGKYWIENVLDECENIGITADQCFVNLARQAQRKPFAEANFLKKAFLEACRRAGLFS